jgi:hypothetical protein
MDEDSLLYAPACQPVLYVPDDGGGQDGIPHLYSASL